MKTDTERLTCTCTSTPPITVTDHGAMVYATHHRVGCPLHTPRRPRRPRRSKRLRQHDAPPPPPSERPYW